MKSPGIRDRILLAVLMPAALVAVLVTGMLVANQIEQARIDQHRRLNAVARQLATAAEFGIFVGNTEALERLLESALREQDVVAAAFLDPNGKVLASTLSVRELPPPEKVHTSFIPPANSAHTEHWHVQPIIPAGFGEADLYMDTDSTMQPPPALGRLLIKISMASLQTDIQRLTLKTMTISLIVLLCGVLVAMALSRGLIRTLTDIRRVVEGIGQGRLDLRIDRVMVNDELGDLAEGINRMAAAVGQTQEQLAARIAAATATLRQERDAAEHAAQARSRFFAAASHDLRQPAQALGLFATRLERVTRESALHPQLHKLAQTVHNLQGLIDTLLDYSRLDGQVFRVEPRPLEARQAISRVVEGLAEAAAAKQLALRLHIADCWLLTDPALLHRILINLIGNAVRHTRRGGILVACRRGAQCARIEVWDTGPGIPPESREAVFEELVQLDNPERNAEKGLGLGLAIVRRSAALLNHPLALSSRVGHGSRFSLRIPLALPPAPAGDADAAAEPLPMLLVGAPGDARDALARQLEGWDFAVKCLAHATAAQAWIARHGKPRALLLDVPDGAAGIERWQAWLERIEATTGGALPVLFVCGGPAPALAEQSGTAARLLLSRPFRPARLRALLGHLLEAADTED